MFFSERGLAVACWVFPYCVLHRSFGSFFDGAEPVLLVSQDQFPDHLQEYIMVCSYHITIAEDHGHGGVFSWGFLLLSLRREFSTGELFSVVLKRNV
jgi:hypothetical protein